MKSIIFWGATGQAKVLRELVEQQGYSVIAVFDNNPAVPTPFSNVPIYYGREGFDHWRQQYGAQEKVFGLAAIGGANGAARVEIQDFFASHGIEAIVAIHPSAYVATDAILGNGCQILAHATVCTEVQLGRSCLINSAASVDHECVLGQGVHIAPGAVLTGNVTVGDYSMIGAGAVVLPNLRIGNHVIVGAGSVVTKSIPNNKVAYGNPARIIRDRE